MINFGLTGSNNSKRRREILGEILGIGYGNSKQFLNRLNNYGISKEEFIDGLKEMEKWNGR